MNKLIELSLSSLTLAALFLTMSTVFKAQASLEVRPPKTHPIKILKPWQKTKTMIATTNQTLEE